MRLVTIAIAATTLAPFAAVAGPAPAAPPPSDFGLTFSTASTTTVSTLNDNNAKTTTPGNIVSKHVGSYYGSIDASTYTVTSADGFFFQQGVNVEGRGSASSTTTLDLTFTNTQSTAQNIRFDSYVIPGHFGVRQVGSDYVSGAIDFKVTLQGGSSPMFQALYTATGDPGTNSYSTTNMVTGTSNNAFNGSSNYSTNTYFFSGHPVSARARDWWDHRFYLDLGNFMPGESKIVTYASTVSASVTNSDGSCNDLTAIAQPINYNSTCSGIDVSFGDPRNHGGVVGANIVTQPGQPGSPIVGFANNPFFTPLRAYQTNRPEAPQDVPPFTPNYNGGPNGGGGGGGVIPPVSTPEPAAFALFGLGALGLFTARRANAA